MMNFLSKLVNDAETRVQDGYYDIVENIQHEPVSLSRQIKNASGNAVIAEIKPISPALGPLKPNLDAADAALKLEQGGAVALSILTEPDNFGGSITNLLRVRQRTNLPILMKDIIVHKKQIKTARQCGADCVLFIQSIFSEIKPTSALDQLMKAAHELKLEVLLEIHNEHEFQQALSSSAEIIGVNNRNLKTLEIDLQTTTRILADSKSTRKTIISESGLETADDVRRIKSCVDGFLIGSAIMLSENPESKVREFVLA